MAKPERRRRYFAPLWVAFVLLAGAGATVLVALREENVRVYVRDALAEVLAHPFELGSVTVSVRQGAEVADFKLLRNDGGATLASAARIRVVPRIGALLRGRVECQRLIFEDVDVELARDANGRWSFEGAFRPWPPEGRRAVALPEIVVRGCRVRYADLAQSRADEVEVHAFSATPEGDGAYALAGEVAPGFAAGLVFSGRLAFAGSHPRAELNLRALEVDVGVALARLLPQELAAGLRDLEVAGRADLDADLVVGTVERVVLERLSGRLIDCRAARRDWPFPVENLSGEVSLRERTVTLRGLDGRFGQGKLAGELHAELAAGGSAITRWGGDLAFASVAVDAPSLGALSQRLRGLLAPFEFAGRVGGRFEVAAAQGFPPRLEDVVAALDLEGLDLKHAKVPHPITGVRGRLRLESGVVRVERPLEGLFQGARARVPAGTADLRGSGAFDIAVEVGAERPGEALVLDEASRRALPPEWAAVWDDLQLEGRLTAMLRFERQAAAGGTAAGAEAAASAPIQAFVAVFPVDVRMAYVGFPYAIERITGALRYDSRDGLVRLSDLAGRHGEQVIAASGVIDLRERGRFQIQLRCDDLAVAEDLLAALGEESRSLVRDFGFEGRVKADVEVYSVPSAQVEFKAALELIEGRLRPAHFPYPIELAGGRMVIHNDRLVEFDGVRTPAGARPQITFDGSLTLVGEERRLLYEFDIGDLSVDSTLIDALPERLRGFVTRFGLRGTFHGKLDGWYAMHTDPAKDRIYYRGTDVRSSDAAVDFGLKIRGMKAAGRFAGGHEPQRPNHFSGEVFVESAQFNRLHLTGGEIVFHFGEPHPHVLADRAGASAPGGEYRVPESFVARLQAPRVGDTFQMSVHSDALYGGALDGFLYVDTGAVGDLGGHFVARAIGVAQAAKDVFRIKGKDVKGKARGHVQFSGKTGDPASITGEGLGVIEEGQLAELPLFLGLLRFLKLDVSQARERSFFNEVVLPYRIEGGRFRSDALVIKSSALTLTGSGVLDFQGNVDLSLRPNVVSTPLPIVDQVLGLLKDALARVLVQGDLARPKVKLATAGGLIDIPIPVDSGADGAQENRRSNDPKE